MGRYGSEDFGLIPSWAIAETLRRADARRRAEDERARTEEERRTAVALRRRQRRERVLTFLGSLRPSRSAGPAEA
jgi:hypothetical protein